MNRNIVAAALAACLLPAASFDAAATPGRVTQLGKTYDLVCEINKSDGAALKVRIMVKNTSGHIIKQGAKIKLAVYGDGRLATVKTETAYRDVAANDSIGFDQPAGARRCAAQVTIVLDIQKKKGPSVVDPCRKIWPTNICA